MNAPTRLRLGPDGSLRIPGDILKTLGWKEGSYLEVAAEGDALALRRIEVDPFAEALRKPDEGAFDRIMEEQKRSQDEARRTFEERIRKGDVPPRRPEDGADYWR
jgi:bifunctional DNA-binding transcriptional regulator/antitoxin component of YhaV-PrlF toxin-antitoxin module